MLAELAECVERYGIRNFLFRSDLFTQNREWVAQLCQGIVDRRLDIEWASNSRVDSITPETLAWMKKAGCWLIAYGVESGSQQMLDLMNKKATLEQARTALRLTREAGIKSSIYFLMGLPWDTPETLEANVRFAREVRADFVEIFYTYPFPGTEFHRLAIEKGLLKPGETPEDAYSHPAIGGLYMTREQLADWRRKSLRRIYLDPVYIVRTLRSVRSPGELFQYIKYGLLMLKDLFTSRKPKDPDARQVTD